MKRTGTANTIQQKTKTGITLRQIKARVAITGLVFISLCFYNLGIAPANQTKAYGVTHTAGTTANNEVSYGEEDDEEYEDNDASKKDKDLNSSVNNFKESF